MGKIRFEFSKIGMKDLFSRNNPFAIIFFISILVIVLGLIFTFLAVFVWIASVILIVYIAYFVIWFWLNKWW
jgi:hypothetical protein